MNDRENNPTFAAMLQNHRLRSLAGDAAAGFTVESASGSTYRVTREMAVLRDGALRFVWKCTCPARGRCRHIDACEQVERAEAAAAGDIDRLETIEHTAN